MFFEFTYKTDLGIKETGTRVWGVVVEQQNKLSSFWRRIFFPQITDWQTGMIARLAEQVAAVMRSRL